VEETGSLGMRKSYDRHLFASVIFSWSGQWSAQSARDTALTGFVGADDDDERVADHVDDLMSSLSTDTNTHL